MLIKSNPPFTHPYDVSVEHKRKLLNEVKYNEGEFFLFISFYLFSLLSYFQKFASLCHCFCPLWTIKLFFTFSSLCFDSSRVLILLSTFFNSLKCEWILQWPIAGRQFGLVVDMWELCFVNSKDGRRTGRSGFSKPRLALNAQATSSELIMDVVCSTRTSAPQFFQDSSFEFALCYKWEDCYFQSGARGLTDSSEFLRLRRHLISLHKLKCQRDALQR